MDVDELAQELQTFAGWPTERVAVAQPVLRQAALAQRGATRLSSRDLHAAVLEVIEGGLVRLSGEYEIPTGGPRPARVTARQVRSAVEQLFWLHRPGARPGHRDRRDWAVQALGLTCTADYWRRHGPELALLRVLAEHVLPEVSDDTPRFRTESYAMTYVFDNGGLLVRHEVSVRQYALVEQLPHSRSEWIGEADPDLDFELQSLTGCSLLSATTPPGRDRPLAVSTQGPPVRVGDVLDMSASFRVRSRRPIDHIDWQASANIVHASLRLVFEPPAHPRRVYAFKTRRSYAEALLSSGNQAVEAVPGTAEFLLIFEAIARDVTFGAFWDWSA